jgi:SnoaL-like protein
MSVAAWSLFSERHGAGRYRRVEIDGDQAHLTCYLVGQHHRAGEGASADHGDHLWPGNFFDTHLVRDHEHVWRIRRHRVDSSWADGNVAATHLPS